MKRLVVGAGPLNERRPVEERDCPKVNAFLYELERLCARHDMALMAMNGDQPSGAFRVIKVRGPGDWKTRVSGEELIRADVDGETFAENEL